MLNNNSEIKIKALQVFEKRDTRSYKISKDYLNGSTYNKRKNQTIEKRALKLYLSSLSKEDLKRLNIVEKCINAIKKSIEISTLTTIYETHIINMPQIPYKNCISQNASIIGIRNKDGFFGVDEQSQKQFDSCKHDLDCLHKLLLIKEQIMSGNSDIKKNTLTRKETIILANFLGYGSCRNDLLKDQTKDRILIKSKERK